VKSDGSSSVDSPMGIAVEMPVPRDILLSMNEYMNGIDNLVKSTQLWERANEQVLNGRKGMNVITPVHQRFVIAVMSILLCTAHLAVSVFLCSVLLLVSRICEELILSVCQRMTLLLEFHMLLLLLLLHLPFF